MRAPLAELPPGSYTVSMTYGDIKKLLIADPYVPFTITMADGRTFLIDTPRYTGWSRDRQTLMFNDQEARFQRIALQEISRLEIPAQVAV